MPRTAEGKKAKVRTAAHTRLFAPYRALGLVAGPAPFAVHTRGGRECYLTVPAGKCVQIFNVSAHSEMIFFVVLFVFA
jgi:hypothetical protein